MKSVTAVTSSMICICTQTGLSNSGNYRLETRLSFIDGQVAALPTVSLRRTSSVPKDDRQWHYLLGNHVVAFASPSFVGTFHVTSRNTLSLTAHVARTAASNLLISLQCHSYPSWAHSKIYAQKTAFSRSSIPLSSVHCTHSAHGTGHCTRSL